jgi:hypothetical protein
MKPAAPVTTIGVDVSDKFVSTALDNSRSGADVTATDADGGPSRLRLEDVTRAW